MTICKPGTVKPHSKFKAEVYVLSEKEGGRQTAFCDKYRPQFFFRTTDVTGGIKILNDKGIAKSGETVSLQITLINKVAMEVGLRFAIREGGRTVGAGKVAEIME